MIRCLCMCVEYILFMTSKICLYFDILLFPVYFRHECVILYAQTTTRPLKKEKLFNLRPFIDSVCSIMTVCVDSQGRSVILDC